MKIITAPCSCSDGCDTAYLLDTGGVQIMLGCIHSTRRWHEIIDEREQRQDMDKAVHINTQLHVLSEFLVELRRSSSDGK